MSFPDDASRPRIAVLMTVFNRADLTLACLQALHAQDAWDEVDVEVVMVDDNSSDGTAERVAGAFPDVRILHGDGQRFWNGGMRMAWADAHTRDPDFYLWLNDDTMMRPDALGMLLSTYTQLLDTDPATPAIVVGATVDPNSGELNYSGVRQDPYRRLSFVAVRPDGSPQDADTMNGNIVLIPRRVVARLGTLSSVYTHSMGDYDYGMRARLAGCRVVVAPDIAGECGSNPGFVPSGDVQRDWERLRSTKHLPFSEWRTFAMRWAGPFWPIFWISPYLRRTGWMLRRAVGLGAG